MRKIKSILGFGLVLLLFATRFYRLDWGLPFPFHPDERNMAMAITSLSCPNFFSCLHPHFFAYGQFPLYGAYFLLMLVKLFLGNFNTPISFVEATLALRIISATASVLTAIISLRIINQLTNSKINKLTNYFLHGGSFLLLIFSPILIQLAHFGTTESLLMLFYSLLVYLCLKRFQNKLSQASFIFSASLIVGLATATKISSLIFIFLPVLIIIIDEVKNNGKNFWKLFFQLIILGGYTLVTTIIFSPYNFIDFTGFLSSFTYESAVALGKLPVFYTQQFFGSVPLFFQLVNIFPYALGGPVFTLFILGFLFLPWKKEFLILRLAFFIYFLPSAFSYVKWTRFMAPVYPVMVIFALLFMDNIIHKLLVLKLDRVKISILYILIAIYCLIPGITYLNIYSQEDTRIQASQWIDKNIPENAFILQETGNVVDLPLTTNKYFKNIIFDFYNLDTDLNLQLELEDRIRQADYIIVPSRRIFMNYTCANSKFGYDSDHCQKLKEKYPLLNQYYRDLFSGKSGFKKVAEFSTALFSDESAEETWSVFDHPVIRIYKKS